MHANNNSTNEPAKLLANAPRTLSAAIAVIVIVIIVVVVVVVVGVGVVYE